jgi:hypothetical protein
VKKILVIDDQRIFKDREDAEIIHETTSDKGFITLVMNGPWDEVWLDHDLGMESSQSGYEMVMDVVSGLEDGTPLEIGKVYVHSMNPVGADRMVQALTRYFDVARIDPTPYLDFDAMYAQDRNPYLAGPRR